MARVIALSNQKGGVGKTTSTINIAACLAAGEQKVLIIDLDPQSNSGSGLGIYQEDVAISTYHVLVDEVPLKSAILHTELNFLDIAPNLTLEQFENNLVNSYKNLLEEAPYRDKGMIENLRKNASDHLSNFKN